MIFPVHEVHLPADLVWASNGKLTTQLVDAHFDGRGTLRLHHEAARAWNALYAGCMGDTGIALTAVSAGDVYRTYAQQQQVFLQRYTTSRVSSSSKMWNGTRYYLKPGMSMVATPGTSNHGLGLAIDVAEWTGSRVKGIAASAAWPWLLTYAALYGFSWEVQSEAWHIRLHVGDATTEEVLAFEGAIPSPPPPDPEPPVNFGDWPLTVKPVIRLGARGNVVAYMQQVLHDVLAYNISVDGDFGPKTQNFVVWFQATHSLQPDGIVGRNTWAAIDVIAGGK